MLSRISIEPTFKKPLVSNRSYFFWFGSREYRLAMLTLLELTLLKDLESKFQEWLYSGIDRNPSNLFNFLPRGDS
jgi:hypothetical protein